MRDPLQVLLALRRIGAHGLEESCHPGDRDERGEIVPFVPTELFSMTRHLIASELSAIEAAGNAAAVRGSRFIVASADTHWYGAFALKSVLSELDAEVIDLGADAGPGSLAAAAAREAWPAIAVSVHNGQCLEYATQLMDVLTQYGASVPVYVGGKLNAILEEDTEPRDMTGALRDLGAVPCASIAALVDHVASNRARAATGP